MAVTNNCMIIWPALIFTHSFSYSGRWLTHNYKFNFPLATFTFGWHMRNMATGNHITPTSSHFWLVISGDFLPSSMLDAFGRDWGCQNAVGHDGSNHLRSPSFHSFATHHNNNNINLQFTTTTIIRKYLNRYCKFEIWNSHLCGLRKVTYPIVCIL